MLDVEDVRKRVARLEELALGLAKERALIREAKDDLLYLERKAYLNATGDALAGVEAARVVLARVLLRIGEGKRAG